MIDFKNNINLWILISGVLASIIIYGILVIYLSWPISEFSIADSGTFGDSFGFLTSLYSGLAFAILIVTLNMQKEELKLQRQELAFTREELRKQKEEFATQNKTLKIQKFENTYFQLVSLHNQNVDSLVYRAAGENVDRTKRECFRGIIRDLRLNIEVKAQTEFGEREITIPEKYDLYYDFVASSIEHYQKTLYQILSFVDQSEEIDNKKTYSNFLRAQLSIKEIELLFFHCLSRYGKNKFKLLVENYEFFEHLKPNKEIVECMKNYDKSAFGNNLKLLRIYEREVD